MDQEKVTRKKKIKPIWLLHQKRYKWKWEFWRRFDL